VVAGFLVAEVSQELVRAAAVEGLVVREAVGEVAGEVKAAWRVNQVHHLWSGEGEALNS
jgi:hypothetical protein